MKTIVQLVSELKTYFIGKDTASRQAVEANIAPVETDATSSAAPYSIGDQLILNDILYKATAAIAIGDALAVGTNIDFAEDVVSQTKKKQDQMQVTSMPTASASNVSQVLIYIGPTTSSYTSGQSYQCVEESGSYSWNPTSSGGGSAQDVSYDNTDSGLTATNVQAAIDEVNRSKINTSDIANNLTTTTAGKVLDATQGKALNDSIANNILYFTSVACSATTGNFVSKSDAKITANHVVAECSFANPAAISTDVTWTTASGSLVLRGTCNSATTCNIVLVKKTN